MILLGFGVPSFAKTSTDLLLCGALEVGVGLLNGVASLCSDSVKFNQTDASSKLDTTLKTSTVSYGISAALMALAGVISVFDSRIDYEGGRTARTIPVVITGVISGALLSSMAGMITSSISFETASEKDNFSNMLGTSLGSTVANWIAFIGALRWAYYMKVLEPNAPNV